MCRIYVYCPRASRPFFRLPGGGGLSRACTWMIDTHAAAGGIYRAAGRRPPFYDRMPGTQPITCGQAAGRDRSGGTLCPSSASRCRHMTAVAYNLSPTAHGLLCGAFQIQKMRCATDSVDRQQELPQLRKAARANTRSTRTHRETGKYSRPQDTQYIQEATTPGEQKNPATGHEDLSGGFCYSSVVVWVWPAVSASIWEVIAR